MDMGRPPYRRCIVGTAPFARAARAILHRCRAAGIGSKAAGAWI
jgi:hypothetical protein